jgi:CheY-like chemotaxis protein
MGTAIRVLILEDEPADVQRMLRELRGAGLEPAWERVDTEADFLARLDPAPEVILSASTLCLPRVPEGVSAAHAHPAPGALPRGHETVLLVEDEDAVRALTRHVLRRCGYTVLEARDGAEALDLAGRHAGRVDLLLTDVVMPVLGGRELAQRLAGLRPELKVLFLSGYTDDAVVRHGVREAETAFLQKPFTPSSLALKLREVLGSSEAV